MIGFSSRGSSPQSHWLTHQPPQQQQQLSLYECRRRLELGVFFGVADITTTTATTTLFAPSSIGESVPTLIAVAPPPSTSLLPSSMLPSFLPPPPPQQKLQQQPPPQRRVVVATTSTQPPTVPPIGIGNFVTPHQQPSSTSMVMLGASTTPSNTTNATADHWMMQPCGGGVSPSSSNATALNGTPTAVVATSSVLDRYSFLETLGTGAFSRVVKAECRYEPGTMVAIKCM